MKQKSYFTNDALTFPANPPDIPPFPQPDEPAADAFTTPSTIYVSHKPEWEYRVIERGLSVDGAMREEELNALGKDGWELVAVLTPAERVMFYLKRAI